MPFHSRGSRRGGRKRSGRLNAALAVTSIRRRICRDGGLSGFRLCAEARLATLAQSVGSSSGWRRSLLAASLGVLAAAALPPVHALPLLLISFTGLVWLIHASRSPWRAAVSGWLFGFAHFVAAFYWIGPALLTGPSRFGWLAAPAVIGLSAGFALLPASAAFAARLPPLNIAGRTLAVAIAWTVAEWLRGTILTGLPMNLLGTVWAPSLGMIQATALFGVYGLSFVTVLAAAAPAALTAPRADEHPGRRPRFLPVAALALLAAVWVGGQVRLALAPDGAPTGLSLRIVHPDVDQKLKWQVEEREALAHHVQLSHRPGFDAAGLVIWPETAAPFFLDERAALREYAAQAAPPGGHLLTGAPRRSRSSGRTIAFWNSLHALTPAGAIAATYDKHRLVPFGEYTPLRAILPLPALAVGEASDYSAGPGAQTLRLQGVPPFSPLICYEAIFPGEVVAGTGTAEARPQWLLNITNDAWFAGTAGPRQHFQAARLRAVEEGLPLVRAANRGISAVVDAYGRVVGRLGPSGAGVLDAPLPPALAPPPQARLGSWTLAILLLLATGASLAGLRRGRAAQARMRR